MPLDPDTRRRIESLVEGSEVVLFMKGTRHMPQCGFSATTTQILDSLIEDYETVDVLSDPAIREGIKAFSSWPTIPQLYVKGEFVGGCDIVRELYASGELHEKLGRPAPERRVPALHVSDAAASALAAAAEGNPGKAVHLQIDAGFRPSLFLAPPSPGAIEVQAGAAAIHFDLESAARADGLRIDVENTPGGPQFRVDNPNAPSAVKQLTPSEVKSRLDAGETFLLLDVRTAEERATASIPGSRLFDEATAQEIEALDRETVLVFHCHRGGRSQSAAERFVALGFRRVFNMAGGIDAWSLEVDPGVPRY